MHMDDELLDYGISLRPSLDTREPSTPPGQTTLAIATTTISPYLPALILPQSHSSQQFRRHTLLKNRLNLQLSYPPNEPWISCNRYVQPPQEPVETTSSDELLLVYLSVRIR